ncbi:hypothetical protein HDU91_006344, partial [Kappamyces sp. JEL0680]
KDFEQELEEFSPLDEDLPLKSVTQAENREGKATGTVKARTYWTYILACGGYGFIALVLSGLIWTNFSDYLQSWWIEKWTDELNDKVQVLTNNLTLHTPLFTQLFVHIPKIDKESMTALAQTDNALFYVSIFGLISSFYVAAGLFVFSVNFLSSIRASRSMHERLVHAILGSPMRFFETTPVGRIINRFSKDLQDIDATLAWTFYDLNKVLFGSVFKVLLVSIVTPPFIFSLVLVFVFWGIARYFLATARELKRLESVSNSPIYALFGEVLNGVSTIRAFGAETQFIESVVDKVDGNHRAAFYQFCVNRWLSIQTGLLSVSIVFVAGVSVIISGLSAGWAGLAFGFATQITQMIKQAIQSYSYVEMAMNSVERVQEYSELPQEPYNIPRDETKPEVWPPADWPTRGEIEVKDLVIRYAPDLPEVLKEISFKVQSCEKIGIVGRTGAGKSTLSLAFFRILPYVKGTIFIDGIDISTLGVRDMRSKFTMIPQDPVLFEGTLRSNLDPMDEHTDQEVWDALRLTHVLESLQDAATDGTTNITLDAPVSENGNNYSQGQRQLLCLARALLRSSRFIFMDEATASVDPETDAKIQNTIRSEFAKGTILTVAHRVLVLDQGKVAEYGTPFELLAAKGIFYGMCQESGDYEELVATANRQHQLRATA